MALFKCGLHKPPLKEQVGSLLQPAVLSQLDAAIASVTVDGHLLLEIKVDCRQAPAQLVCQLLPCRGLICRRVLHLGYVGPSRESCFANFVAVCNKRGNHRRKDPTVVRQERFERIDSCAFPSFGAHVFDHLQTIGVLLRFVWSP